MHLDAREYPANHHFAAIVSEKLGMYVKVANFTTSATGRRMFRMIVDAEIDKKQMRELLFSTFKDSDGAYEFSHMEAIMGPIVDNHFHRCADQQYIRVTFM